MRSFVVNPLYDLISFSAFASCVLSFEEYCKKDGTKEPRRNVGQNHSMTQAVPWFILGAVLSRRNKKAQVG